MKTLPTQFFKNGFTHLQLHRTGMVAVFRRWKEGAVPHFEVVVIGSHNGFTVKNAEGKETKLPPAETYPSSEQWGAKGFTYKDEESALAKFRIMASQPEGGRMNQLSAWILGITLTIAAVLLFNEPPTSKP